MRGQDGLHGHEHRARVLERRVRTAYRSLKKTNAELRNRIEQLSVLHRISLAMRDAATEPQRLWEMMLKDALNLLRGDSGAIYLLDDESGILRVRAAEGLCADGRTGAEIPLGAGLIGYVARTGTPLLVPDVTSEPRYQQQVEGIQSQMAAPMTGGQSVIGVINIESRKLGAFKPSDMELLMTLAAHAARVWENAMLYRMAQERNQQLIDSYEKLRQTQEQLIKKERLAALGEMAATVAHEIRNPMTAIRGFAQRIARRLPENTTEKDYLGIIISEVDRLDEVIQSVLDFGKKPVIHKQPTAIADVIGDALMILDAQIKRSALLVETKIASRMPSLMLDEDQAKQVIINLVQNAVDATPQGRSIAIDAAPDTDHVMIRVTDSGTGIEAAMREKIFDPFFTTKVHGTGLGLAMVKRIVEEHGGTIGVENITGKGAAFTVRLPLPAAGAQAPGDASTLL